MRERQEPTGVKKAVRTTARVILFVNLLSSLLLLIGMLALIVWLKSQ